MAEKVTLLSSHSIFLMGFSTFVYGHLHVIKLYNIVWNGLLPADKWFLRSTWWQWISLRRELQNYGVLITIKLWRGYGSLTCSGI